MGIVSFGLDQAWLLIVGVLVVGGAIGFGIFWRLRQLKKLDVGAGSVKFSGYGRLFKLDVYRKLFKKYLFSLQVLASLLMVSIFCFLVVVAKPVTLDEYTPTKYNRDIVLCLDVSGSMIDVDLGVLERMEEMVTQFKGERVSLVIWNTQSHMMFPLTDDYDYISDRISLLKESLMFAQTGQIWGEGQFNYNRYVLGREGASLVGDGLTACTLAFGGTDLEDDRSKSIILATDNVVNGEETVTLSEAAEYADSKNVTVYGILPVTGWEVGGEEESMRQATELTGGEFYKLEDPSLTENIVDLISAEQTGAVKGETVITKFDIPDWFIIIGVAGFIVFMIIARRVKV